LFSEMSTDGAARIVRAIGMYQLRDAPACFML
jgi:hypothetical protein